MKIVCVGRNYSAHAQELGNKLNETPILFLKPDTALLKDNMPFYYPGFSKQIQFEVEFLVKIDREGKYIEPKFAHKYYNEVGLGIDFTARDLQNELKSKGLPWEISKSFNHSAVVSNFVPKDKFENLQNISFSLQVNGSVKQQGNSGQMLFSIDEIIAYASTFFTLKKGDIIFTGTPQGVGDIHQNDLLEGYLEDEKMFECRIK